MKELCIIGVLSLCLVFVSIGGADGSSNRQAGVEMSVSVSDNTQDATYTVNGSSSASGVHTNVGVWRPRGHIRNHTRPPGSNLGPSQPRYVARGSRRRPAYIRRFRERLNRRRNRQQRLRSNGQGGHNGLGLVATGSHSIASTTTPQGSTGLDAFVALQGGHGQSQPFQDRQTAYDFLSNGGNSFRARNRQQQERRDENAKIATVMCGVFGRQFIPSAIGGRCVDPPQ